MSSKIEIATYLLLKSDPFLLHLKDIKGKTVDTVGIYPLQAVSRAEDWKKSPVAKGITIMSVL